MEFTRWAFAAFAVALAGACNGGHATPSSGPVQLEGLHRDCSSTACVFGQTCLSYYGVAGASGPRFSTCEIPCKTTSDCPAGHGLACTTISDGPGTVCD